MMGFMAFGCVGQADCARRARLQVAMRVPMWIRSGEETRTLVSRPVGDLVFLAHWPLPLLARSVVLAVVETAIGTPVEEGRFRRRIVRRFVSCATRTIRTRAARVCAVSHVGHPGSPCRVSVSLAESGLPSTLIPLLWCWPAARRRISALKPLQPVRPEGVGPCRVAATAGAQQGGCTRCSRGRGMRRGWLGWWSDGPAGPWRGTRKCRLPATIGVGSRGLLPLSMPAWVGKVVPWDGCPIRTSTDPGTG